MTTPFTVVPNEIWADRRLTLEQLRVLGSFLSFCGPDRQCFPSRDEISKRSGVHLTNVSSATTTLEHLGWLTKVGKGGFSKANRYTIHVPETLAYSATVAQQARGKEQTSEQTRVVDVAPVSRRTADATAMRSVLEALHADGSPSPRPKHPGWNRLALNRLSVPRRKR